jgi:hypothetical protein
LGRFDQNIKIPWASLAKMYHQKWNLSRPILLENSPPEIFHADSLFKKFSKTGAVRFVLLVRSPCQTKKVSHCDMVERLRYAHDEIALRYGGK